MKFDKDKFKEWMKSKYAKPLLFFGFYFIFFAFVLMIVRPSTNVNNNADEPDMWNDITTNYEYRFDVTFNDGQVITLEGKKYNNKNLFTKRVNDVIDSEVYTFYNEASIKKDNKWMDTNDFVLVNQYFNDRYFDIDYLKDLIADAELTNSITNFDDSVSEAYSFGNINVEVVSADDVLKKINIVDPLYKINIQYKNINEVKDFVVEK